MYNTYRYNESRYNSASTNILLTLFLAETVATSEAETNDYTMRVSDFIALFDSFGVVKAKAFGDTVTLNEWLSVVLNPRPGAH